mgnify:CR=1 FL=1
MARPIKRGVSVIDPSKVDKSKLDSANSESSARYRGKAIPNSHPESSLGRVFVLISFPFSFWLLMNAVSESPTPKLIYLQFPFCAFAVFGLKRFRNGAVASLVLTTVGLIIYFMR